ncbi:MAG: hypothetical protein V4482_04670 [Pseudomonadota bacterium]
MRIPKTILSAATFCLFITCAHSVPFFNTLLCKTNDPIRCASRLARDAASMTGAGFAMTLCESDPSQCNAAMFADAAIFSGATVASHFGVTAAIGGFLGTSALATSPFGGPIILGGAVGAAATLVVAANLGGKTAYCNTICTPELATDAGPLFQSLIKANPNASITELIAITKGAVKTHDLESQQKLVNAIWCVKYCPSAFNQRFMCKMLEKMHYSTPEDQETIVSYGRFLASTGTVGGFHQYLGPDQINASKLGKFIEKNTPGDYDGRSIDTLLFENVPNAQDKPEFCYQHLDESTASTDEATRNNAKDQFNERYNILKNIYTTFKDIKNDVFMRCTLHGLMKNGVSDERLIAHNPVHNDERVQFYIKLRDSNDEALTRLLRSRGTLEREQQFCQRLAGHLDTRMPDSLVPSTETGNHK